MSDICRQTIADLQPNTQNSIIVGIIIRSQNFKMLDATRSRYNVGSRAVWNFTIRDSIEDFINATVWGSVEFVNKLFTTFHVGDVVEVINAKVSQRHSTDPGEIYVPSVTSPFSLTLNQSSSLMKFHDTPAVPRYRKLIRIPTKNPAHARRLKEITEHIEEFNNEFVDIVVAVTFVSQTREVYTRTGELSKIRDFEVIDESVNTTIPLTLWDLEWIKLADEWKPKETILFLADAQVIRNDRMKKSVLSVARKTVITENPEITEAFVLRQFMKDKPDIAPVSIYSVPNPNSITKRMTINDITQRLNIAALQGEDRQLQLLVIVQAIVEELNIDSPDRGFITSKCAKCKRIVPEEKDSCMNLDCPFGSGMKAPMNITSLNIIVNIRDDTGYLIGCRLRDEAAECAFGCSAEEIKKMSLDERIKLKGKFYQEVCDVRLQILGPTPTWEKSTYNILAMNVVPKDILYEDFDIDQIDDGYD